MLNAISLFRRVYLKLLGVQVAVGTLLRIALLFNEQTTDTGFTAVEWLQIFALGALNEAAAFTVGFAVLWIFCLTVFEQKYRRPYGHIFFALLAAAWCYVTFCNTIFDEYGSVVPRIASGVIGYWALSFGLRLFVPRIRDGWTRGWFVALLACYTGGIIMNAVSEWFFWSEFGVRYNFIAVDYLVYTNEVVGNIMESYPIVPILAVLLVVTGSLVWWLFRREIASFRELGRRRWKPVCSEVYAMQAVCSLVILSATARLQNSDNVYVNELQAAGVYKFYDAFLKNELDYKQFYPTLPDEVVAAELHARYGSSDRGVHRMIEADSVEQRPNIFLVTMESMSASFMAYFSGAKGGGITPELDSLYARGIAFTNLFATGNRTVRGLEAVTLSLPPCPGQSIIKRPSNGGLHSTAEMLSAKGYTPFYFYGGNSYFDNMETFFSGNGYRIVDSKSYTPDEIQYANIWGVCDEDSFDKALRTLDDYTAQNDGAPFFAHLMTVSNHRPYTYPAGRIPIPNDSKRRAGGVMYADYALGRFLRMAAGKPWFDNTVFVITADHCASSAGKTDIPLDKYHIPAVIYAPSRFAPAKVDKTASQIDLMPTLFALLGMGYESHFYGRNVLADDYEERAFIATYQDMGYLENDTLTVLSPVDRVEQFVRRPTAEDPWALEPIACDRSSRAVRRAITYYQSSAVRK